MKYKKIYLEVTNRCNLSCDFCIKNKRELKNISIDEFKIVLTKLKPYTKYLYFHILGEPLLHPNINELITIATKEGFFVNITTNGYLINNISNNKNIRQLNISLHSYDKKYQISLSDYLNNIFNQVDNLLKENTYISLRLWVKTKEYNNIINCINKRYNCNIDLSKGNYKIKEHLFINSHETFIWPDLNNNYYNEVDKCYGLIDHIGILVDGTIIPCCLDSKGIIKLGNIYKDDLEKVITNKRCINMIDGFKNNIKKEELCKHCGFIQKD